MGPVRATNRWLSFAQRTVCSAIGDVARFASTDVRFIGWENSISTHERFASHPADRTVGGVGTAFRTSTFALAFCWLPLVSVAIALRRWAPSESPTLGQTHA